MNHFIGQEEIWKDGEKLIEDFFPVNTSNVTVKIFVVGQYPTKESAIKKIASLQRMTKKLCMNANFLYFTDERDIFAIPNMIEKKFSEVERY